ncbi:MAG: outer membrane lipoprotein carrier protein LolA [Alphaproteobacteria bacterium]|nr:outer membrane lipoprotein carrier protein LolA [Alphaproteobacteria bacterium]
MAYMHILRAIAAILCLSVALAAPASAQTPPGPADKADIERIGGWLNGLTTLDTRFVQFSSDGRASGRMLLRRPDKLRVEYDPPTPVLLVASGTWIMHHDKELLQTSFYPVSETPAAFLLREHIDLDEGLKVTDLRKGEGVVQITLVEAGAPAAGSITLQFDEQPLRLARWRVVDAQGATIDIALVQPRFGGPIGSEQFSLVDPNLGRPVGPNN